MQHISHNDLEELRGKLEEERSNLEKELSEHGRNVGGNWQGTAAGFEGNEADETDGADKMEELATNIALVETLEQRYKEVVAALRRMDEGTYGLTENGEKIESARLRANPAATTNIE